MSESTKDDQNAMEAVEDIQPVEDKIEVEQVKPSPGEQLAARREEMGLTPERVAEQLKMTPRQILAIEADNHASVHSKAIFRGFVRAYAKVLKMDPEALVAMIPDDPGVSPRLTPIQTRASTPFSESRIPFSGRSNSQSRKTLIAIFFVALLIAVLVGQKMGWVPSLPKSITEKFTRKPASAPPSVIAEKREAESSSASVSVESNENVKQIELPPVDVSAQLSSAPIAKPATEAVTGAVAPPAVPPESSEPKEETPVADTANVLVLKCKEESWFEIKRSDGSVMAAHKIPAGTTERFRIAGPVQLTLGNGPGVHVTLRGIPLKISADAHNKVVRLNLK